MNSTRRTLWAVGVAVVVVIVIAVSSMGNRHSPARPVGLTGKLVYHGTRTVRDGTTVMIVLGRNSYSPTYLRGPAGARVVVHLEAEGFHAHTFTVPSLGIDVTVAPGGVADVPITIPDAPTTVFFCRFHQSLGMQGAVIAQAH